jgi:Uma2 family endonuclease
MLPTNLYSQLEALPKNMTGEIIGGRLVTMARPAGPHGQAESVLGADILPPYQQGRNGPGGWWIIDEPEVHFIRNIEVVVPDIAGWKKERMRHLPRTHRYEVVPDWVCEIASPSTAKLDRIEKMPLYAKYGVRYLWLVDPLLKTLEVYELHNGNWLNIGMYKDNDAVSAVPFNEIVIQLDDLWIPEDVE